MLISVSTLLAMTPFKLSIKLFTQGATPPLHTFIPIFHQWIRDQNTSGGFLPDHLLIDVADYAHVQNGPGIVLVSSQANLYIDENGGRPGLLYVRKTPNIGTLEDHLRAAIAATLRAAARLEADPSLAHQLKFDTHELQINFNDRLLTPNNAESLATLTPAIAVITRLLFPNQPIEVRSVGEPRDLLTFKIVAPTNPSLGDLLKRVDAGAAVKI